MADLVSCPYCKGEIDGEALKCRYCGEWVKGKPNLPSSAQEGATVGPALLGIAGAAVMGLGVFLPAVHAPIIGSVNLVQKVGGEAWALVALSGVAAACFLIRIYIAPIIIGILGASAASFYTAQLVSRLSALRAEAEANLAGNPFKGLASGFTGAVQIALGPYVVGFGGFILALAGFWGLAATKSRRVDPDPRIAFAGAAFAIIVAIGAWAGSREVAQRVPNSTATPAVLPAPPEASTPPTGQQTAPPVPAKPWLVSKDTSALDDSPWVTLFNSASSPIPGKYGDAVTPALILRCSEKTTVAYINWNMFLGTESTRTRYRIDSLPQRSEPWSLSTDNEAAGLWSGASAIPFIKSLLGHSKLLVEVTPYGESPKQTSFDLTGIDAEIAPLCEACGWVAPAKPVDGDPVAGSQSFRFEKLSDGRVNVAGSTARLVTGEVRNTSAFPVYVVKVTGVLKSDSGREIGHSFSYAGNVVTKATVATRPRTEVEAILATRIGEQGVNVKVEAGASEPFALTFYDTSSGTARVNLTATARAFPEPPPP